MNPSLLFVTAMLPAVALAQPRALDDCDAIYDAVGPAYESNDTAALRHLYEAAEHCGQGFRNDIGLRVARTMLRAGRAAVATGDLATAESTLADSLTYGRQWQALAMLGDLHREGKDYAEATRYYQDALEEIRDEEATPTAPSREVIQRIFRLAEQTRLLAPEYVSVASRSTGAPGGLAASSVRGFVPVAVAIPVTFEFDSTEFTDQGKQAVADLLRMIKAEQLKAITLIGHADPTGSDDYNLKLSARRAEAVGTYLTANGYPGTVRTEGHGEREPLEVDQTDRYSQDELYRMYRRVEFRRE